MYSFGRIILSNNEISIICLNILFLIKSPAMASIMWQIWQWIKQKTNQVVKLVVMEKVQYSALKVSQSFVMEKVQYSELKISQSFCVFHIFLAN